jgi:nucleoside 2-deoxyribosyltransferase
MIYLASPYSHPDPAVREARFEAVCRVAATLIKKGHVVFSPIAHSYPMVRYGLPDDWQFWSAQDRRFLEACDELWVLTLDGWQQSIGIHAEIAIARELGKTVRWITPELKEVRG